MQFFGKPTKLDFFVEVSGLKPTPGFSLPIKLRFLQELEDEQQKEHALTEVRGSVLFLLALKATTRQKPKVVVFFSTQTKQKGYGPGCENSSRKVFFFENSEVFTS